MDAKELYLELNKLFCEAIFSERMSQSKVFLDVDSLSISSIDHLLIENESEVSEILVRCVRSLVSIPDTAAERSFRQFDRIVREWDQLDRGQEADRDNPPPVVPLLLVFVLAAERMGNEGENANNYYVHLLELLNYPSAKTTWLQQDFKETVLRYFQLLADWLDEFLGDIGVPTFPGPKANDYVGICIRQALIRTSDRTKLHRVFQKQGFAPHQDFRTEHLVEYLMDWSARQTGSLSTYFWRHFDNESTRLLLTEAVRTELLRWDGVTTIRGTEHSEEYDLQLQCTFSNGFFGREFGFEFVARVPNELLSLGWRTSFSDNDIWLASIRNGYGHLQVGQPAALVKSDVTLASVEGVFKIKRRAEKLVVLGLDDITGKYLEQKNIKLGQRSLVLAIELDEQIVEQLETYLRDYARAGFSKFQSQDLGDLPEGWILYTDVEMLAQPENSAIPLFKKFGQTASLRADTVFELQGGIRLEGINSNYLAGYLPNVLAVSSDNVLAKIVVGVTSGDRSYFEKQFDTSTGSLLINLNEMNIGSAAVTIKLFEGLADKPSNSTSFRSYTLDGFRTAVAASNTTVVYKDEGGKKSNSIFGVRHGEKVSRFIDLFGNEEPKTDFEVKLPLELVNAVQIPSSANQFNINTSESICFTRGHHIWQLGPALPKPTRYTLGSCECGGQRVFDSRPIDITARAASRVLAPGIDLGKEIVKNTQKLTHHDDFDMIAVRKLLTFSRHGSKDLLLRLLSQFSAQIDSNDLAYILEIMGHINLLRAPNGNIETWSINPYLELTDRFGNAYSVGEFPIEDSPRVEALPSHQVSLDIGMRTPNLSQISDALQLEEFRGGATSIEKFNVNTMLYDKVPNLLSTGAFRLRSPFGNKYVFISEATDKIDNLKFGPATLVKHLGASLQNSVLVSYQPNEWTLTVPFGCELIGSIGKMVGVVTPKIPRRIKKGSRNFWIHEDVSPEIANLLNSILRG